MIVGVISIGVMTVGVLSVGVMTVGVLSVGVMTLSQRMNGCLMTSLKIPKGNQNLYSEEEQTTQWPKEKV